MEVNLTLEITWLCLCPALVRQNRDSCEEDQAEKPHCPVKLCSYFIAQEQLKQRICKIILQEKGEEEGGKKERTSPGYQTSWN